MDDLKKLIDGVINYCNENNIEFVFTSIDPKNRYTMLTTNVETNVILKRAVEILRTLL